MKLPFLPIYIDSFCEGDDHDTATIFMLSHFHTDHMKGLVHGWSRGYIVASIPTRELIANKFGAQLASRVIGLPLWRRIRLLRRRGSCVFAKPSHPPTSDTTYATREAEELPCGLMSTVANSSLTTCTGMGGGRVEDDSVYVTLLPSFHIPGSVMFYLETNQKQLGTVLYTGDFKYERGPARKVLDPFFARYPVDHIFIDDTWLHLGITVEEASNAFDDSTTGVSGGGGCRSGLRVLSKLLNAAQVDEAIETIGRRMEFQWSQHNERLRHQLARGECINVNRTLPFKLRVYLHNQFGKEMLIQRLAARLGTRALLDDERYGRLSCVVAALHKERESSTTTATTAATEDGSDGVAVAHGDNGDDALARCEQVWRASGGEGAIYALDMRYFISFSEYKFLLEKLDPCSSKTGSVGNGGGDEAEGAGHTPLPLFTTQNGVATAGPSHLPPVELPLIEVVGSRASISAEALCASSEASHGTPHYGVVISGWARLQGNKGTGDECTTSNGGSGNVWHMPTTLHCTPQEIIDFVAQICPASVTALHYKPSRGPIMMARLGPHLRTPYVNRSMNGGDGYYVSTAHHSGSEGGDRGVKSKGAWIRIVAPEGMDAPGQVGDDDAFCLFHSSSSSSSASSSEEAGDSDCDDSITVDSASAEAEFKEPEEEMEDSDVDDIAEIFGRSASAVPVLSASPAAAAVAASGSSLKRARSKSTSERRMRQQLNQLQEASCFAGARGFKLSKNVHNRESLSGLCEDVEPLLPSWKLDALSAELRAMSGTRGQKRKIV